MDGLQLRPAVAADAGSVAEVHLQARRAATMPPPVHTDDEVRAWLEVRLRGDDEIWVAEVAGAVVGYARLVGDWLDDLYVAPEYAGRGVGGTLLDLVKGLRPAGFCLWVFESNTGARAFYAHRGLVELERTDGSANEERSPDLRVAWPGAEPLVFFRTLIDEVDDQLGDLFARRAALTRVVQAHKSDPRRDPERERRIAAAMALRAPELGAERLARIVDVVITESLAAAAERA